MKLLLCMGINLYLVLEEEMNKLTEIFIVLFPVIGDIQIIRKVNDLQYPDCDWQAYFVLLFLRCFFWLGLYNIFIRFIKL